MRSPSYHTLVALTLLLVTFVSKRASAAPFVNLNFEQATVPPGTPAGFVPASQAFPGWTPRIGNSVLSTVAFNETGIGEGEVVLFDMPLAIGGGVPQGRFGACLITDLGFNVPASLSQVGDVPAGTKSLRLLADNFRPPPVVRINATDVPLVRLTPPGLFFPIEYGADITSFAGQTVDLAISSGLLGTTPLVIGDAITLSATPIPEPQLNVATVLCLLIAPARRSLRS